MTVSNTLEERGKRYGKFADHAKIAQGLQEVLHQMPNWPTMDYDMKQALCVICDKMARIGNGDPFYDDNWHDIQGYAKLVEDRLKELQTLPEPVLFEEPSETPDRIDRQTFHVEVPGVPYEEAVQRLKKAFENSPRLHSESKPGGDYVYRKEDDPQTDVGYYRG